MTQTPQSLSLHQWIEISVGDKSMPVYVCTPAQGKPKAALLVLQEIFGVNPHIRGVTERLAAEGYLVMAPDLFHRQGNRFECGYSEAEFQAGIGRMQRMSEEQALHDIDRVIANLDAGLKVGVVGFCLGGRLSFLSSFNARVSAAVSFYGSGIAEKALRWGEQVQAPLLLFYGEKDQHITATEVAAVRTRLSELHKEHEIRVYGPADHGFFNEGKHQYEPGSAQDAWARTLKFFAEKLRA